LRDRFAEATAIGIHKLQSLSAFMGTGECWLFQWPTAFYTLTSDPLCALESLAVGSLEEEHLDELLKKKTWKHLFLDVARLTTKHLRSLGSLPFLRSLRLPFVQLDAYPKEMTPCAALEVFYSSAHPEYTDPDALLFGVEWSSSIPTLTDVVVTIHKADQLADLSAFCRARPTNVKTLEVNVLDVSQYSYNTESRTEAPQSQSSEDRQAFALAVAALFEQTHLTKLKVTDDTYEENPDPNVVLAMRLAVLHNTNLLQLEVSSFGFDTLVTDKIVQVVLARNRRARYNWARVALSVVFFRSCLRSLSPSSKWLVRSFPLIPTILELASVHAVGDRF
jgi:hypothetical protein